MQQPTDFTEDDVKEQQITDLSTDLLLGDPIKRRGTYSKADFGDLLTRLLEHQDSDAAVLEVIQKHPESQLYHLCMEISRDLAEEVLDAEMDFIAAQGEDALAGQ